MSKSIWSREKIRTMAKCYARDESMTWVLVDFAKEVCLLLAERDEAVRLLREVWETIAPLQISHKHLFPMDLLKEHQQFFARDDIKKIEGGK